MCWVSTREVQSQPVCGSPRYHTADSPCSARYRGNGTDLSKTEQFRRHDRDSGSAEYQVARLSARVEQLTRHLSEHKKDFATRRGLLQILGQRKQLLAYLQRTDK